MNKPPPRGPRTKWVYRPPTADHIRNRAQRKMGKFDSPLKSNVEFFRAKAGDNTVRILPATWDGYEYYGYTIFVHEFVGPDTGTYLCLNKMSGKRCPICETARREEQRTSRDEAWKMMAHEKVLCWVISRNDEQRVPQPKIWMQSATFDKNLTSLCWSNQTGKSLDIAHPDVGYDVSFQREGTGLLTKYLGVLVEREPSPISDDPQVQDQILAFVIDNPIPNLLTWQTADYLSRVMSGTASVDDDVPAEEEQVDETGNGDVLYEEEEPAEEDGQAPWAATQEESEEEEEPAPPPRRPTPPAARPAPSTGTTRKPIMTAKPRPISR